MGLLGSLDHLRLRAPNVEALVASYRDTLDAVGETTKGTLWRVTTEVSARPAVEASVHATAAIVATVQLVVMASALLLALPTAASRREARRTPRVVGPYWQEGR